MIEKYKHLIGATTGILRTVGHEAGRELSSDNREKLEELEPIVSNSFQSMIDDADSYTITYHEGGIRKIAMYFKFVFEKPYDKVKIDTMLNRCMKKFMMEFRGSKNRVVNIDKWGVTESAWDTCEAEVGIWRYKDAD